MFDAAVWGTVGQWVSGLASSGALVVGASVLGIDLHRKRRAQATSVIGWMKREDENDVTIGIQNLSDQPIFNYGFVVADKPMAELKKIAAANAKREKPQKIPDDLATAHDYHAVWVANLPNAQYVLGPKQVQTHLDKLSYSRLLYDFYFFFTDAYGRRWVKDVRTNKLFGRRATSRIHPSETIIKALGPDFEG